MVEAGFVPTDSAERYTFASSSVSPISVSVSISAFIETLYTIFHQVENFFTSNALTLKVLSYNERLYSSRIYFTFSLFNNIL